MSDFWKTVLAFAETTTTAIGAQLLLDFGHARATEKEDGSLVTPSDQWADQYLQQAIQSQYPDFGYLSEESEHVFPSREWCWIVDPLDGTTNFSRGIPLWGTSMALVYRAVPVFGYVHLPPIQQTFYGFWPHPTISVPELPQGAFLNHERIQTSSADPGPNQLFNFCSRSVYLIKPGFPCKIRMLGGAAYNMLSVASGTFLGAIEQTPKIWDIAGVWVILQAAGASWIALDDQKIFPLRAGYNYGQQAFPTLVVSRSELVPLFARELQIGSQS